MVVALACRKQSRRRRRMTVQRHLSKSSLESGGTSSMTDEGSTTIIAPITATPIHHPHHHANKQSSPRHVHFTLTTIPSSSLENNNNNTTIHPDNHRHRRHDQEENDDVMVNIALIPTLDELDVSALYYTRQEIRDMGNRAKAQARTAKSLARILSLQAHVRVPCFDHDCYEESYHHDHDDDDLHLDQTNTSPTTISSLWQDYESLVLLYEHDTVRQTSSTAFRGLEHLMIGHDRESRKLAIQRILQVQDDTVVRQQQQQDAPQQQQRMSLMRMRSLLHSRKSCHLAARVGATDALEANTT